MTKNMKIKLLLFAAILVLMSAVIVACRQNEPELPPIETPPVNDPTIDDSSAADYALPEPPQPYPDPPQPYPEPPQPYPEPPEETEIILQRAAFITRNISDDAQYFTWREFERLAYDFGFEVSLYAGEYEPEVEFNGIVTAISEGYDAIFINPSYAEAVLPALTRAREVGIVVGMLVNDLPPEHQDERDFFIGTDYFEAAKLAGRFVVENFPYGANFVEVGGPADENMMLELHYGFREGIADENVQITEIGSQNTPTGWNVFEAFALTRDFITRFEEEIDIVFTHWDEGATGVIEALQMSDVDSVFVIGIGGSRAGFEQVRAGTQLLSVGKNYTDMAALSLENARTLLDGGTVSEINIIHMNLITIDTIDDFHRDW
jgi:ABC-type sugar transport system substrate-binding protein